MASALLSSASAPDFAITAYFNADLSMRSTASFVASLARIASLISESTRSCNVIGGQLRRSSAIVDVIAAVVGGADLGFANYCSDRPQGGGYSAAPHLRTDSASPTEITLMPRFVRF